MRHDEYQETLQPLFKQRDALKTLLEYPQPPMLVQMLRAEYNRVQALIVEIVIKQEG